MSCCEYSISYLTRRPTYKASNLLSVRRVAPKLEPIRSRRAAAGLQLSTPVTNLREHLRPSDQIHRTVGLRPGFARRSLTLGRETVPPSAPRLADSWLPDDHRLRQRLAGLLHPRRCRYSRMRILMPGPHRY